VVELFRYRYRLLKLPHLLRVNQRARKTQIMHWEKVNINFLFADVNSDEEKFFLG